MKKQFIHGEGITGIYVEFTYPELMVMKAFVERAAVVTKDHVKGSVYGEPKELIQDAAQFFNNLIPEEVTSLEGAYKNLFAKPVVADNEL